MVLSRHPPPLSSEPSLASLASQDQPSAPAQPPGKQKWPCSLPLPLPQLDRKPPVALWLHPLDEELAGDDTQSDCCSFGSHGLVRDCGSDAVAGAGGGGAAAGGEDEPDDSSNEPTDTPAAVPVLQPPSMLERDGATIPLAADGTKTSLAVASAVTAMMGTVTAAHSRGLLPAPTALLLANHRHSRPPTEVSLCCSRALQVACKGPPEPGPATDGLVRTHNVNAAGAVARAASDAYCNNCGTDGYRNPGDRQDDAAAANGGGGHSWECGEGGGRKRAQPYNAVVAHRDGLSDEHGVGCDGGGSARRRRLESPPELVNDMAAVAKGIYSGISTINNNNTPAESLDGRRMLNGRIPSESPTGQQMAPNMDVWRPPGPGGVPPPSASAAIRHAPTPAASPLPLPAPAPEVRHGQGNGQELRQGLRTLPPAHEPTTAYLGTLASPFVGPHNGMAVAPHDMGPVGFVRTPATAEAAISQTRSAVFRNDRSRVPDGLSDVAGPSERELQQAITQPTPARLCPHCSARVGGGGGNSWVPSQRYDSASDAATARSWPAGGMNGTVSEKPLDSPGGGAWCGRTPVQGLAHTARFVPSYGSAPCGTSVAYCSGFSCATGPTARQGSEPILRRRLLSAPSLPYRPAAAATPSTSTAAAAAAPLLHQPPVSAVPVPYGATVVRHVSCSLCAAAAQHQPSVRRQSSLPVLPPPHTYHTAGYDVSLAAAAVQSRLPPPCDGAQHAVLPGSGRSMSCGPPAPPGAPPSSHLARPLGPHPYVLDQGPQSHVACVPAQRQQSSSYMSHWQQQQQQQGLCMATVPQVPRTESSPATTSPRIFANGGPGPQRSLSASNSSSSLPSAPYGLTQNASERHQSGDMFQTGTSTALHGGVMPPPPLVPDNKSDSNGNSSANRSLYEGCFTHPAEGANSGGGQAVRDQLREASIPARAPAAEPALSSPEAPVPPLPPTQPPPHSQARGPGSCLMGGPLHVPHNLNYPQLSHLRSTQQRFDGFSWSASYSNRKAGYTQFLLPYNARTDMGMHAPLPQRGPSYNPYHCTHHYTHHYSQYRLGAERLASQQQSHQYPPSTISHRVPGSYRPPAPQQPAPLPPAGHPSYRMESWHPYKLTTQAPVATSIVTNHPEHVLQNKTAVVAAASSGEGAMSSLCNEQMRKAAVVVGAMGGEETAPCQPLQSQPNAGSMSSVPALPLPCPDPPPANYGPTYTVGPGAGYQSLPPPHLRPTAQATGRQGPATTVLSSQVVSSGGMSAPLSAPGVRRCTCEQCCPASSSRDSPSPPSPAAPPPPPPPPARAMPMPQL